MSSLHALLLSVQNVANALVQTWFGRDWGMTVYFEGKMRTSIDETTDHAPWVDLDDLSRPRPRKHNCTPLLQGFLWMSSCFFSWKLISVTWPNWTQPRQCSWSLGCQNVNFPTHPRQLNLTSSMPICPRFQPFLIHLGYQISVNPPDQCTAWIGGGLILKSCSPPKLMHCMPLCYTNKS